MRKLFLVLVCLALVFGFVSPSFAGSGRFANEQADNVGEVDTIAVTTSAASISRPAYVYAVTCYATASGGILSLYDNTTASGTMRVEVGEATSGASKRVEFTKPIKFDTGVYVYLLNADAMIEYR